VGEACRTICLLDLDEPLERVITAQLGHDGFITERGDSLEAVAVSDPAPAAVVFDLDALSPLTWTEQVSWLVRCSRRAPLLVLSSDRIPPRRARSLEGAAILYKPFTLAELRSRLADCMPVDCGVGR
jgi:DNA-binding response OmpR family regulator